MVKKGQRTGVFDMQQEYNIPLINNKAFNNKNKAVIQLYKEVSSSRNI